MKPAGIYRLIFLMLFVLTDHALYAQLPYKLLDGRQHRYCESCRSIIESKPVDVLFGISINDAGEIYFIMDNREWFDKIIKNDSYGITVDLVSKDRYACGKETGGYDLPKGKMLAPLYRQDLLKNSKDIVEGAVYTKIGNVPASLKGKEIEGNLVVLNGNYICYYTNFLNIDRSAWRLLPMGLFTDTLINENLHQSDDAVFSFSPAKRLQVEIPFSKASSDFPPGYLQRLYDSLNFKNYRIRSVDIRAYSSVEGPEAGNKILMEKRATAVLSALQKYQPDKGSIRTLPAENWLEFFTDIEGTEFEWLNEWSKTSIKQKLADPVLLKKIEPILARHRKVVLAFLLEERSAVASVSDTSIEGAFKKAIQEKDIPKARLLQRELMERVIESRLPMEFASSLEVPQTKEFSPLLNDREVYKYMLRATTEYEALQNFIELKKLDPKNGRIGYNICAIRFFAWQYAGDTLSSKLLLKEINALSSQGIHPNLVKRMLINYYILKSEDQLKAFNYKGKDSSVSAIRDLYKGLPMTDEDIYSMARYFSFYMHREWALEITQPRIDKIDVSEDLVFYYLNLLFFDESSYSSPTFEKACLNAANLNRERFCRFFTPNHLRGAGIQLLEDENIKFRYCENCK